MRAILERAGLPGRRAAAVRLGPVGRSPDLAFRGGELVVEDAATADPSGSGPRPVLQRGHRLARAGPAVRRRRGHRDRQLLGLADGPRGPAGGARGQRAPPWRSIPKGIVANPNCTTMVAMPVLKPLHDAAGLDRLIVSTYQAVSGLGPGRGGRARGAAGQDGRRGRPPSPSTVGPSTSPRRRSSPTSSPTTCCPWPATWSTTARARPTRSRSSATRAARSSTSPTWR